MFLVPDVLIVLLLTWILVKLPKRIRLRWVFFILGLGYLFSLYQTNHYTAQDLGLTWMNAGPGIISILAPTILMAAIALAAYLYFPVLLYQKHALFSKKISPWLSALPYLIISVPIQEAVFRGLYLHHLGQNGLSPLLIVLISSLLFAILHAPFGGISLVISTFLFGMIWSQNALTFGTIIPSIVSHAILGAVVLALEKSLESRTCSNCPACDTIPQEE